MRFAVKILGLRRLRADAKRWARRIPSEAEKRLRQASEVLVGAAQRQFKGSRTRSLYAIKGGKRVRRKVPRPITAPPNRLAVFEGTYRRAISYNIKRSGRKYTSEVGPVRIRYARVHEFGEGRMPKRPVMTPAVKETQERIFRILGKTFEVVR